MLSTQGLAALRRYRTDPAAHIRHVGPAADHTLGQAHCRVADQDILLDVDPDIAPDRRVADYKAYNRLAVEEDKQRCCLEALGIALAVHGMDIGQIPVEVGLDTMGSVARKVPAGV